MNLGKLAKALAWAWKHHDEIEQIAKKGKEAIEDGKAVAKGIKELTRDK
jgi:hypothetical protein